MEQNSGYRFSSGGVVYLVNPTQADFSGDTALGNYLLVANAMAYGAYIALSQDLIKRYGALTVITWIFAFGCIATVPIGGFYLAQTPQQNLDWAVWLAVLYIIIVPTVCAYYLNAWALARVAPSTVAAYIYLQPLIAFVFAPLILGEKFSRRTWIAAALIFTGVAVITWRARSRVAEEVSECPDAFSH